VFAGAGTVGVLATAAAVLPLTAEAPQQAAGDCAKDSADGRYQLTQHVLQYYRTAKV
jgi:hypothetical protein